MLEKRKRSPKIKWQFDEIVRLGDLHKQGMSNREIGLEMGIPSNSIGIKLRRLGLKYNKKEFRADMLEELKRLYFVDNENIGDIAVKMDFAESTIKEKIRLLKVSEGVEGRRIGTLPTSICYECANAITLRCKWMASEIDTPERLDNALEGKVYVSKIDPQAGRTLVSIQECGNYVFGKI